MTCHNQAVTALSINTLYYDERGNPWTANLDLNNNSINLNLDTGTEIDVLPKAIDNNFHQCPILRPISNSLTAYSGTNISVLGKYKVFVIYKKVVTLIMFIVADTISQPVLSSTNLISLSIDKPQPQTKYCNS